MSKCSKSTHGRHTPVGGICIGCGANAETSDSLDVRKPFSEVFEGAGPQGKPLVTLRRLTDEEKIAANLPPENTVGIFWAEDMIACVDFDDLFDGKGNYFYND